MADIPQCLPSSLQASNAIASEHTNNSGHTLDAPTCTDSTDDMANTRLKVETLLVKYGNIHNNNIQQSNVGSLVKSFSATPLPLSADNFMTSSLPAGCANAETKSKYSEPSRSFESGTRTKTETDKDDLFTPVKVPNSPDGPISVPSNPSSCVTSLSANAKEFVTSVVPAATADDRKDEVKVRGDAESLDVEVNAVYDINSANTNCMNSADKHHIVQNGVLQAADSTSAAHDPISGNTDLSCSAADTLDVRGSLPNVAAAASKSNPSSIFSVDADDVLTAASFCLTCHEKVSATEHPDSHETVPVRV